MLKTMGATEGEEGSFPRRERSIMRQDPALASMSHFLSGHGCQACARH